MSPSWRLSQGRCGVLIFMAKTNQLETSQIMRENEQNISGISKLK